jgi:hypothetical protein
MPDITASPAIDTALGLIFLFFLLSLICSTVNEIVSNVLSWRARFLEDGLRSMLTGNGAPSGADDLVRQLASHPLISGKVATPVEGTPRGLRGRLANVRAKLMKRRLFPSYLNTKTFALTFLDTVAPPDEADSNKDVLARAREYIETLDEDNPVRRSLLAFLDQAGKDVNRFRKSVESWFDLTMDRVSGWYKRRTQFSLAIIATIVVLAFNADSLQVGRALWNDDAVRAAVVAQAQKSVDEGATKPAAGETTAQAVDRLSDQVADVNTLKLPLGWSTDADDPRWFDSFAGAVGKLFGLVATVLALLLGAPFWFDLLGRVSRVRVTGKPERPGAA